MEQTWTVTPLEHGIGLFDFLKSKKLPHSNKKLKAFIDMGHCFISNNRVTLAKYQLRKADVVTLIQPPEGGSTVGDDRILFEDDALILYDKPAHLASDEAVLQELFQKIEKKVFLVHRLDKATTGVLLLAKTKEVKKKLEQAFYHRSIKKQYLAIADGFIEKNKDTIENNLAVLRRTKNAVFMGVHKRGVVSAITRYSCIRKNEKATLVLVEPITGKTHQIRVHMEYIGHPLLGDLQYARSFKCKEKVSRHMLHALSITFVHPITGEKMTFSSKVPVDMKQLVENIFKVDIDDAISDYQNL